MITEALLESFLKCPLKAHYLLSGRTPPKSEHDEFDERVERIYADKVRLALGSILFTEPSNAMPLVHEDLSAHPDALERAGKSEVVVPIRVFPRARISDLDRMRLGFDGLVIGRVHGSVPTHGLAIVGPAFRKARVALPRLIRHARRAVDFDTLKYRNHVAARLQPPAPAFESRLPGTGGVRRKESRELG